MGIDATRAAGRASLLLVFIGSYLLPAGSLAAQKHMMSLSAASLNFGNVNLTSALTEAVTVTNTGTAPLSMSIAQPVGDYAETNNCTASLAQREECTIWITFKPSVLGTRNGAVKITND